MTAVCIRRAPGDERPRAAEMPAEIAARLEVAPRALIERAGFARFAR